MTTVSDHPQANPDFAVLNPGYTLLRLPESIQVVIARTAEQAEAIQSSEGRASA